MDSPIKLGCIIDDDNMYISLLKKIIELKRLSQNLLVFSNGKEALDHFKAILPSSDADKIPEIIFLDVNMPVMDGWQFLEEFLKIENKTKKSITIYVVSSSIDPKDYKKAKTFSSVTDYLIKPINISKIEEIFTRDSA